MSWVPRSQIKRKKAGILCCAFNMGTSSPPWVETVEPQGDVLEGGKVQ